VYIQGYRASKRTYFGLNLDVIEMELLKDTFDAIEKPFRSAALLPQAQQVCEIVFRTAVVEREDFEKEFQRERF
jgi:hypothetical protein